MFTIKDLYQLKYKRELIGLRVVTDEGISYDIGLDSLEGVNLGYVSVMPSLTLIKKNGVYMTKDEDYEGENDELECEEDVAFVVNYINNELKDRNMNFRANLRKKRDRIGSEVRSFIPYKLIQDYIDYAIHNFEGNRNIYNQFNERQVNLIRKYFRYMTRKLFREGNKNRVLQTKPMKAKELVHLMEGIDDWQYDGAVDTGVFGGGVCALGHILRYEHYAYSASSGRTLVFGTTCASDFFDIDKPTMDRIIGVQNRLVTEMKVVSFYHNTGRAEEKLSELSELDKVARYMMGGGTLSDLSYEFKFILAFRKEGISLPSTLAELYRRKEFEYEKFIEKLG